MFELFLLLFVLVVFVAIGHGIWVATSAILRAIFGRRGNSEFNSWKAPSTLPATDPQVFRRVLERMRFKGLVSPEEFTTLIQKSNQAYSEAADVSPSVTSQTSTPALTSKPALTSESPIVAVLSDEPDSVVPPIAQKVLVTPVESPPTPKEPRATWGSVIESFLALHNIRWGELVAGLLIVVCSIGLVTSLWSTLQDAHRVIPSLVFLTANAAIFAAGFYTLAKWKVRHTSRAVLLIATLLVPLTVLAGLATADQGEAAVSLSDPVTLFAILFGTAINIGLLLKAGRALFSSTQARAFAMAIATPAAIIPFVPAALRAFGASAGWIVMLASVAVAIAIVYFQQPRRFLAKPKKMLTVASRRQWSFLFVASFSLVALSIATAYLGSEFKERLWYALVISCVPAASSVAVAAHSIAIRSSNHTHQFIGKVVSVLGVGLVMLTLPLLGHDPNWLWLWAVTASVCFAGLWIAYRTTPWMVVSTLPVCLGALISSTCLIGNAEWSSLTWPRRIIGGEPMIVASLFAIVSSLWVWRSGKVNDQRALAMLSAGWFSIAALSAALLVFLPPSWLGIVPPSVLLLILSCLTLASAIAAIFIGAPASLTIGFAGLVACAALHPISWSDGLSIAGNTSWMYAFLLATSILSGLCLLFEQLSKPWSKQFLSSHSLTSSTTRFSRSTHSWQSASAALCTFAVALSVFELFNSPMTTIWVAGLGSVVFLVAGDRLREQAWVIASQLATLVAGAAVVSRYDYDYFYSLGDWHSDSAMPLHLLWNWSLVFSVLGFIWIGLREWSLRRCFPLDVSSTTADSAPECIRHFPPCWPAAIATVLLTIGSIGQFGPLLFQRVNSDAISFASLDATQVWLPLSSFTFAIVATGLLSWISRHENTTHWRSVATLTRVSLLLWGSSLCVSLLDMYDSHRLVLAASAVMISVSIWYWLSTRSRVTTSPITITMGFGVLMSSSASLLTHDWFWPLTAGLSPDRFASLAVSSWWLFVSAGLLVSSLKKQDSGLTGLSAVIAIVASTIAVPVLTDLQWMAWFQAVGLATLAWAKAAEFVATRTRPISENNETAIDLPARRVIDGAWLMGIATGIAAAAVGVASLVSGPSLLDPMVNPISFILVATTAGIATIRGIPVSTSLPPSMRYRIAWPLAITMLASQISWLVSRFLPQLGYSPTAIVFTLFTVAAAASLYRYGMLRSRADAWHVAGLAVLGFASVEATSTVLPEFSLVLIGILGAIICIRLARSGAESTQLKPRLASWFVIAAGCWTLHHFASPVSELEQFWTYFVAWAAGWTLVWSFGTALISRQFGGEAGIHQSRSMWPEFGAIIVVLTLGECCGALAGFAARQPPVQLTSLFLLRWLLVQTCAMVLWLRAQRRTELAITMSVTVAWLAAATVHVCDVNEMSWEYKVMCAVLVTSFASAMLAFGMTPITEIYRIGAKKFGVVNAMDDESHSIGALCPLMLAAIGAAASAFIMFMLEVPISTIQLTIGGIAISAIGVSEIAERVRRDTLRRLSLALAISSTYFWASLSAPDQAQPFLCGLMRWFVLSVSLIPMLLWGLPRLAGENWASRWRRSIHDATTAVSIIGTVSLIALLSLEAMMKFGSDPLRPAMPLVIAVGLSIGMLSVIAAIVLLASGPTLGTSSSIPQSMKLELAGSKRSGLLVAAQVLGVLTWLHIYFCKPHLAMFGLRTYWPYLVMVLAFVSVGATEWVKRRGDELIAKTLNQTSLYLPLIPAVGLLMSGVWIKPVSGMLGGGPSLSIVLIVAAGYYVLLSRMREGWMPRVLLVVFANSAVWSLVAKNPEWSFLQHPQLWLIPPAVCVLAIAQVYRKDLDAQFLATVRYTATILIYVSSTADMMLQQIGTTLWGPMVLIMLALAGMLAGVALQIRPFLYLGTVFVLLGVTSMVWHAQRSIDQVWPWWAFGITMGIVILAGLMSLEKNKGKLQELATRLNSWES